MTYTVILTAHYCICIAINYIITWYEKIGFMGTKYACLDDIICDWLYENPPYSRFTQVHTNACNFLTDAPIYTCFTGNIVWLFGIYCVKYGTVIDSYCKITTLYTSKNRQSFHANMEGFCRASHIYLF